MSGNIVLLKSLNLTDLVIFSFPPDAYPYHICGECYNNRELKQRRRQQQRKRHLKIYLYFICASSRLFQLVQLLQDWRTQIRRSGVQVKKENEKFTVVRSRSPQNLKCGHFTLLFDRGRQRNVPNYKTHVQSDCFCSLKPLVFGVLVAVAVVVA